MLISVSTNFQHGFFAQSVGVDNREEPEKNHKNKMIKMQDGFSECITLTDNWKSLPSDNVDLSTGVTFKTARVS